MKTIKCAVLGFGRIGKRHAKIISEYSHTRLTAIIDIEGQPGEEANSLGYNVPFFKGVADFVGAGLAEQTDVVHIATPNGTHAGLALQCLEAGMHIVIEKPMALRKTDCEQVLFRALEVNKQVFVVKQNRYSPVSKWLKEMVGKNILGDIYMVQVNCYWNRDERYYASGDWHGTLAMDGGILFTQFSHFIDILYWVFGDVKNISAQMQNMNHRNMIEFEDTGTARFEFERGGMGCINFSISCWDQNMESSITVVGSKGSAKIGGQYMNEVEYCHIKDYDMPELPETNPPNDYGPYKGSAANHHYVIENVVNTLNGKEHIKTNALEGMKVVEIIEKIYEHR